MSTSLKYLEANNNFLKYLLKSAAERAFYKELHLGRKSYKT